MALKPNASDVDTITIVDKPPIYVTSWDYNRLWNVVEAFRPRGAAPLVDLLAEELDRAEIVEPAAIPHDVVTMHSCVSFVDNDTDQVRTVTLVYPGEEDSKRDRIAVSTPVGSALLGLRSGATMAWRTLDGRTKRLTVLDVQHQPEAKGFDGASGPDDRGSPHSGTPISA
jgi:regulator of nucleoside diphosphate kinase